MSSSPSYLFRFISCFLLFAFLFLKATHSWIFDSASAWLGEAKYASDHENNEEFLMFDDDEPSIKSRRCDACRIIASRVDVGLELAEARLLGKDGRQELVQKEVDRTVTQICALEPFEKVKSVIYKDQRRLAGPGTELWRRFKHGNRGIRIEQTDYDWPRRLRNHCLYLMDKLSGHLLYQTWLRTSANVPESFEMFLCHGETVFSDCMDWTLAGVEEKWPMDDWEERVESTDANLDDIQMDFIEDLELIWEDAIPNTSAEAQGSMFT